jgi:hypothetical protein
MQERDGKNPRTGAHERRPYFQQQDREVRTTQDTGTKFAIWASGEHYSAGRGIGMKIDAERRPQGSDMKSKIELDVSHPNDAALDRKYSGRYILRNGGEVYLGFAIRLDPEMYQAPLGWVIHFQVWHCCGNDPPPLSLRAIPAQSAGGNSIRFTLLKRDDSFLSEERARDPGNPIPFLSGEQYIVLRKGQWYFVVLRLRPSPGSRQADGTMKSKDGLIDMWLDGEPVLHYRGAWGYSPARESRMRDTYAVKLGIYRRAQDRTQTIYLDDIRWGLSYEAVAIPRSGRY